MAKGEDITTKFKVDISDLKKGITDANNQIKLANSEFKKASAGMDNWAKSSDGIKSKLTQLKSVLEAQNAKLKAYQEQLKTAQKYEKEASTNVENLRKALDKAKSTYGANSTEVKKLEKELSAAEKTEAAMKKQVGDLTVTMNNQEGTVKKTQNEMKNLSSSLADVTKAEALAVKNGTTVDQELKKIEQQADKTDSKVGKLAKTLAKTLVAGAVAAAAGVVALGKASIDAYADYEQLVGGVDTLFGKSSKQVQEYANNAYKTAGLSANKYMETVTGFSASLLKGLGGDTEKAARYADMAITDMSDNANKMGTDIGSIQNAYQGFAKQNYTMLDNLKLGYGGTKEQMALLVKNSGVLGKAGENLTAKNLDQKVSYDQIIEAIHITQERMGMAGTTSKEAATTIQGSTAAMKGAWTNLLVGFADGTQDMDTLVKNFIDSVGTVAQNVLPRISEVMSSIGGIIKEHLPEIAAQISTWVSGLLDDLIAGLPDGFQELATAIKDGLGVALDIVKELFSWIMDNGDLVVSLLAGIAAGFVAFQVATTIAAVTKALEGMTLAQWLLNAAMSANPIGLVALAIGALITVITLLVLNWDKVKEVFLSCWEAIKNAWGNVADWFKSSVIEPLKNAFSGIDTFMSEHFGSAWEAIKLIWDNVTSYFEAIWESIKGVFSVVKDVFTGNWQGAWDGIKGIVETWKDYFSGVWDNIKSIFEPITSWFSEKFTAAKDGIINIWNTVADWFNTNVITPIKNFFQPLVDWFTELWNSISETFRTTFEVIGQLAEGCWNLIKLLWGLAADWFNENVITPVKEFFTKMWDAIKEAAQVAWDAIKAIWTVVKEWFNTYIIEPVVNLFKMMWDGIKTAASATWEGIKSVWNAVSGWFDKNLIQPVSNFFTKMWDNLKKGASQAWAGVKNAFSPVTDWFKDTFTKAWTAVKNVFSTGGKIFDGIKEGITSTFKTVVNGIIRGINKVVKIPFDGINKALDKIRNISIAGVQPFSGLLSRISVPQIPELATGIAKAKKGHQYLLEGKHDETVLPLHKNAQWIKAMAGSMLNQMKTNTGMGLNPAFAGVGSNSNVNNFTQIINAPKAPSRIELYRQTRNLLDFKGRG